MIDKARIAEEAQHFFIWPDPDRRDHVTLASCVVFANVIAAMVREESRALLAECLPHVRSAAQASHLTDGFRPRRNAQDELVQRVDSASNSQPTRRTR